MAQTAPSTVTITCPVCGETEVADGSAAFTTRADKHGDLETWLNYNAAAEHDCPGITPAQTPKFLGEK